MPHKTVEARFNCAFINATLIYGYRVAKGCFCFTFIYLYFSLFFSSSSDFFCKYLSIYFFPIFFWPPFARLFVLIFSHAERAFCLILFGSQIAPNTNNIRPTTIRATPTKNPMRLRNLTSAFYLFAVVVAADADFSVTADSTHIFGFSDDDLSYFESLDNPTTMLIAGRSIRSLQFYFRYQRFASDLSISMT